MTNLKRPVYRILVSWAWVACMASAWAGDTGAVDPAGASPRLRLDVTSYALQGQWPVRGLDPQDILAPYTGRGLRTSRVQEAAAALQGFLDDRGWALYRVRLPAQPLQGQVWLDLQPQRVERVTVQGVQSGKAASDAQVRQALPGLREGQTPNLHQLAAQSALANENSARQLQVVLAPSAASDPMQASDGVDATIQVREQRPWDLGLSWSNHGNDATGRDRLTLFGRRAQLAGRDIEVQVAATTSLERAQSVRQLGASFRVPLYSLGWQLTGLHTRSDVIGSFGSFSTVSAGQVLALGGSAYLATGGAARHQLGIGLQDKRYEPVRIDGVPLPGQVDRRSRPWVLSYAGRWQDEGGAGVAPTPASSKDQSAGSDAYLGQGRRQWAIEWARNTGGGSGNTLAAHQSEDARIDALRWRLWRASASQVWAWSQAQSPSHWQLAVRAQAQWASRPLIAGEQFGLGGPTSLRGTRQERPLAGDAGWLMSWELSSPAAQGWRALAFVDAGGVASTGLAPGRPAQDALTSVGLGVRMNRPHSALVLDYGRIIRGSSEPLSLMPWAPQRGDDRLYVTISLNL